MNLEGASSSKPYSLLIRGARVVDGSGNPWFWGDVALRGDRIATLSRSPLQPTQADQVLNAEGRCVCPGFIDVQSHSIIAHMLDGRALSKVHQGVTTEIMGERWTPAPFGGEIAEVWKEVGVPLRIKPTEWEARMRGWNRFCDWPVAIEASGVSVNIGGYLAGGTLREYVRGMDMGESNPAQLEALRQVSHQAMQDGAFGVSYALIYPPESYVSTEEIIEVCKVVAHHGGVYATHMRSEGDEIEAALDEAIHIGKASGAAVHIFHLKAAGQANWSKLPAVLKRIHQARCQGVDVSANMYAYTAGMTRLSALLPSWAASGEGLAANLANPEVKARLHQEMLKKGLPSEFAPQQIELLDVNQPHHQGYINKRIPQIAAMRGQDWAECMLDLLHHDGLNLRPLIHLASEENLERQFTEPWVMIASDAEASNPEWDSATHPRSYGSFVRVLAEYVRERKLLTLEDAIRRMTSFPAQTLQIEGRGLLRPGYFADLVLFDPQTVQDHASYARPHQLATGIGGVWVNGVRVIEEGQHTGALPGRAIWGPGKENA